MNLGRPRLAAILDQVGSDRLVALGGGRVIDSVAVLPFEDLTGSQELTSFSASIADVLTDKLSQLPQLRVVSRSSSSRFKPGEYDISSAAEQLGVRTIVMGKITRSGDDVFVRVEILDAVDDRHLAGFMFQRPLAGISALQGEIAHAAARQLQLELTDEQQKRLSLSETEDQLLQERLTLKQLEQSIETLAEKKQYYRYKGMMPNDKERIHFLRLPIEAREGWATHRGYNAEEEGYSDEIAEVIENNDVAMGMSHKAVVESWGDPDAVEVAGNPIYGNQRWRYSRYISSNDGYQKVEKILYFESGRLVGWETY